MQPEPATVAYLYEASANGRDASRHARPYERIALEIAERICGGSLVRGQKLPTEREMCERFSVSRGVIREAVKMLDAMGLVESRQGSGIYVRNNPIPSISRALTFSVTPDEQSVAALFEFRTVLEEAAAGFAALRHTPAQLAAINDAAQATLTVARENDRPAWHRADAHFHQTISAASGNPYLDVAVGALQQMLQNVVTLVTGSLYSTTAAEHHVAIAKAIGERQPDAAAKAMRAHIAYAAARLQKSREAAHQFGGA